MSSSSVLNTVASISTPESSLQDKPSRSDEIRDIDRAALAQKFSVTRRLFETKVMEVEGVSKPATGWGGKGMADEKVEGDDEREGDNQEEREEEEASRIGKHTEEDGLDKDKSINPPLINISLPKPAPVSLTKRPESPVSDGHSEASNKSHPCPDQHSQPTETQAEGGRNGANADLSLTPEEPVRAELVDVKTESSESDENEEEKEQKETTKCIKNKEERSVSNNVEDPVEALVDDVFESSMETTPGTCKTENKVTPTEEQQRQLPTSIPCKGETEDDGGSGGDKYQQVNEQWEGEREEQSGKFTTQSEKTSTEKGKNEEKKTDARVEESAGRKERLMMQEEDVVKEVEGKRKGDRGEEECRRGQEEEKTKKEEGKEGGGTSSECLSEQVKHVVVPRGDSDGKGDIGGGKEDQTGSAVICGIENEAFVYDQESQRRQEHSASPNQDHETSPQVENQLLLDYEEVPGVPDHGDEDASEAANRKVRFSSAPIKVSKPSRKNTYSLAFGILYSLY